MSHTQEGTETKYLTLTPVPVFVDLILMATPAGHHCVAPVTFKERTNASWQGLPFSMLIGHVALDPSRCRRPLKAYRAAIPPVDAQFHKRSLETHIRGIIAFYGNSLLHAGSMRFHKHPFETHQSHHDTSKPVIPHADAGFRKDQLETQVASTHIKSSHSPCRRSIPHRRTYVASLRFTGIFSCMLDRCVPAILSY